MTFTFGEGVGMVIVDVKIVFWWILGIWGMGCLV